MCNYTIKNSKKANDFTIYTINSCLIKIFHWRSLAGRASIPIAEFSIVTTHTQHNKLCHNRVHFSQRITTIHVTPTPWKKGVCVGVWNQHRNLWLHLIYSFLSNYYRCQRVGVVFLISVHHSSQQKKKQVMNMQINTILKL